MDQRAHELFAQAAVLAQGTREAFVAENCGDDEELRDEVLAMLAEAERADSLFDWDDAERDEEGTDRFGELLEKEGDIVGTYTLRQKIGEGGFGTVWMAEQKEPIARMVALKVVKAGMDTQQVLTRFEAERQALAIMDHPNIARVIDAGATETGRPYFAMELVKGVPITQFCKEQKYDARRRLELFKDVCSAVNHAHQKGIIHRDLKPSNIMVTLHGDQPVPKVIDFGIAKATQGKLTEQTLFTRFEQFLGTPAYMSPEQTAMSGLDIDTRADIYSLGILLYELLAGAPPFDQKSLLSAGYEEMRRIIREDEPPKPSTRLTETRSEGAGGKLEVTPSHLKGELDWIVMKAIDKDRARRYETANAFAADIGRYLEDEPVLAAAPGAAYKFRKFARRNKTVFGSAAAMVLLLLGGIGATSWQAVRATDAQNQADRERKLSEEAREEAETARVQAEAATMLADERARTIRRNLYHAEMNLAVQAEQQDEGLPQLMRITDEWIPKPGQEDLRGWEWYFLRSVAQQRSDAIRIPVKRIWSSAVSPNGKKVAICELDGTIRIVDPTRGDILLTIENGDRHPRSLSWNPAGDRLVCAGLKPTIWVFDAESGKQIWSFDEIGGGTVSWSHNGQLIAVGFGPARPRPILILEAATGKEVRRMDGGAGAYEIAWRPGDQEVAVATHRNGLSIWDVGTGEQIHNFGLNSEILKCLAWSPDGSRIAFAGHAQIVWVYEGDTGHQVHELRGALEPIFDLAWSPNGTSLVSASGLGLQLWDPRRGGRHRVLRGHANKIRGVAYSSDGKFLISSDVVGELRRWKLDVLGFARTVVSSDEPIEEIAWRPDGRILASAGWDGSIRVVDAETGTLEWKEHAHPAAVRGASAIDWSPDGTRLATGGWDNRVCVWNYPTKTLETTRNPGRTFHLAFGHGGDRLFFCFVEGEEVFTEAWDFTSGAIQFSLPVNKPGLYDPVISLSPSGKLLAVPIMDTIEIRPSNGDPPLFLLPEKQGSAREFAWSPDEKKIAVAALGEIRIWDLEDLSEPLILRGHARTVLDVDWNHDGTRLVSAGQDRTCRIWDPVTGKQLLVLREHENRVLAVKWSPDGRAFASASTDGTVKIWDASQGYTAEGRDPEQILLPLPAERIAWKAGTRDLARETPVLAVIVPPTSEWKWLHPVDGVDPAEADPDFHQTFATSDFDDTSWQTGQDSGEEGGGFGYGDDWFTGVDIGLPTVVDAGGKRHGKAAYFRHRFTTTEEFNNLELQCQRDDGIIVYLDGKEVARSNMTAGPASYLVPAATAVGPGAIFEEQTTYPVPLKDVTLPAGEHLLAISLHNFKNPSSDLRLGGIRLLAKEEPIVPVTKPIIPAEEAAIPPRPPGLEGKLLDLTDHYSSTLDAETWSRSFNNLSRLPGTFVPRHGVNFDLRGVIRLESGVLLKPGRTVNQLLGLNLKSGVSGIKVNQATPRIHFLASALYGSETPGETIARFVMHYEDGEQAEMPVVLGPDGVADWVNMRAETVVGWKGPINAEGRQGVLSELIWDNPHPEKTIATIDFLSTQSPHGAPFLVAITLE